MRYVHVIYMRKLSLGVGMGPAGYWARLTLLFILSSATVLFRSDIAITKLSELTS